METRREVIERYWARARECSRRMYVLVGPRAVEVRLSDLPARAGWICVEGDARWSRLPGVDLQPGGVA